MTTPRWFFLLGVFTALILLAFGRSLVQGFAPIDDGFLIVQNLAIRGVTAENLRSIFTTFDPELYIPLTLLSFQVNYLIAELEPWIFHLTNLLLHGGNAMLVLWLVWLLLQQRKVSDVTEVTKGKWNVGNLGNVGYLGNLFQDRAHVWALFAGTLFLLHPIHTEAVVWITGRKDLLSAFFFLLSVIFYLLYRESARKAGKAALGSPEREVIAGRKETSATSVTSVPSFPAFPAFLLSLLLFLLALLSKVMAVTLPVVLLLYDLLIERRRWDARMILEKVPFLLLSLFFVLIASLGKERVLSSSTPLDTVLIAAKSTVFYLQKLFLPVGLSVFYPQTTPIRLASPEFLVPLLIVATLLFLAVCLWSRSPRFTFGILFFLITLAPTFLNFRKGGEDYFAVDRYAYVPSVGIFFLVAWLMRLLLEGGRETKESNDSKETKNGKKSLDSSDSLVSLVSPPWILLLASFVTLLSLASLSHRQTRIWDTPDSLFSHALALYPDSVAARMGVASLERGRGNLEGAFTILKEGLRYGDHPDLRINAAIIYAATGRINDAREQLKKARALDPQNPDPLFQLGWIEEQLKNSEAAADLFRKAIALDRSFVAARVRLSEILLREGKLADAEEHLTEAVRWNPSDRRANAAMALLREKQGRIAEAERYKERAAALGHAP